MKQVVLVKAVKRLLRPAVFGYSDYKSGKLYDRWLSDNLLTDEELQRQRKEAKKLSYRPRISIIVPTYNTPEVFFREMVESVFGQTYDNWELVLVDDASPDSTVRSLIKEYAKKDKRIKHKFLSKNKQIAGATNEAIKIATGKYIALFDHDDLLEPDALFEVAKAVNKDRNLAFIYTDEDKVAADGRKRYQPFFKPGWNPDFLRSVNYITHFAVIRKDELDKFGYEDGGYNGTQDWELFLRITRNINSRQIYHIAKILYSWRVHDNSTAKAIEVKPYVIEAQRRALEADVRARDLLNVDVKRDQLHPAQWKLEFRAQRGPTVSIVVSNPKVVTQVSAQLAGQTRHPFYEIIEIDNQTTFSQLFECVNGEYLVFIDGKIRPRNPEWLQLMMGDAARGDIGLVLARCPNKAMIKNLRGILPDGEVDFIDRVNRRLVARHLYLTTRYNIRTASEGVGMVEVQKLRNAISRPSEYVTLAAVSSALVRAGYYNLYNPYIEVLK